MILKKFSFFYTLLFVSTVMVGRAQGTNTFGIKASSEECKNLMITENGLTAVGNSISIENNQVVLTYHNVRHIQSIFKNPNDGLAIDLLSATQFACGMANEMPSSSFYKGTLLPPVYRDTLLKNNSAKNEHRFIAVVATIPENLQDQTLVPAIIFIKNGVACHWSSPIQIPHKTFQPLPYELQTSEEPETLFQEQGVISSKQIHFQFQRNITTSHVHDPIPTNHGSIHSIEIKSYSSVEGDASKNEVLHTKRAEYMQAEILKKNQNAIVRVEAKENWEKCFIQLEMLGKEKYTKLPHDSIRNLLMLDKENNWDSLYHCQRRSLATIYYVGSVEKTNASLYLSMNLQTALLEKNEKLANKALDSLYKTKLFCPLLLEENNITQLLNYPYLVANTCAVLSLTSNFQSEELIRYVRFWLLHSRSLNPLAKQNLLYLYARTSAQLLSKWDVEANHLAKVLHPSRAEKILAEIQTICPAIIQLDYNIGAISYYSQINEYASIQPKFLAIDQYFSKQKLSMQELEALALFYNHWGHFDLTLKTLYRELDDPEFSVDNAFILAKTASAGQLRKTNGLNYLRVMKKACDKNPLNFCHWVSQSFNLLIDPQVKTFYCQKCQQ
jgi:hypothetical protein